MTDEQMFEVPGDRLRELTDNIKTLSDELERYKNQVVPELGKQLQSADYAIKQLAVQKDGAYAERDKLLAALTKMFPSHLTRHKATPGENWDMEWMNVVCIHLPTGQATWHVHIAEMPWFAHLNGIELQCGGYDGYTTTEKYQRLFQLQNTWLEDFRAKR